MTCVTPGLGFARSTKRLNGTPRQSVSFFDQRVTQWMSPRHSAVGSARNSSQLNSNGFSHRPKKRSRQVAGSNCGTSPTWSTGNPLVTVWPGGTVGSLVLKRGIVAKTPSARRPVATVPPIPFPARKVPRERALRELEILEKTYPHAATALEYRTPFELLIAVILS